MCHRWDTTSHPPPTCLPSIPVSCPFSATKPIPLFPPSPQWQARDPRIRRHRDIHLFTIHERRGLGELTVKHYHGRCVRRSGSQAAMVSLSLFAWRSVEAAFMLFCLVTSLWISARVLRPIDAFPIFPLLRSLQLDPLLPQAILFAKPFPLRSHVSTRQLIHWLIHSSFQPGRCLPGKPTMPRRNR